MREMTDRIAIVGAGMAGLSCADALRSVGHQVTVLDKGRGPGGRMSTRRIDTPLGQVSFDHGAQYFTVRDKGFSTAVQRWEADGVVARWPLVGPDCWVGTPGMNAVIKAMASAHDVRWNTLVDRIEPGNDGWMVKAGDAAFGPFDAVVLAIPAEQALPFLSLHDFSMAREAMLARSQPCWTVMAAFSEPLATDRGMLRDMGALGWVARNAAKPGRDGGPDGWVIQARPEWSLAHIEDQASDVAARLLAEFSAALGLALPPPLIAVAHRWRYAMSAGLGLGALWNEQAGLGVCGDWLLGPRVECAWQSGEQLARAMLDNPVGSALGNMVA